MIITNIPVIYGCIQGRDPYKMLVISSSIQVFF